MKIGVLCFRSYDAYDSHSELALQEAGMGLGHDVEMVPAWELELSPDGGIFLSGEPFPAFDVLISRARVVDQVENRLYWIRLLEERGYPVVNGYEALICSKNKWFATERLRRAGLPTVPTWVIEDESQALRVAAKITYPVIVKACYGTYGLSVEKAENVQQLRAVLGNFWRPDFIVPLLLQPFLHEAEGKDRRLFVVGGRAVAAMERTAALGEFRANMERGGVACALEPSLEEKQLALRAVESLGLDYAGVDLIPTQKGLAILEVNGNADFKALEAVTNLPVAVSIIELAVECSRKVV